jgi:transporter family-2 protein
MPARGGAVRRALASPGRAPAWAWAGGALGAVYVSTVVPLTPRLGLAATLGLALAGQLGAALVLDRLGLLGLSQRPLTAPRVVGAALLLAGVVLIRIRR